MTTANRPRACPACGSTGVRTLLEPSSVPVLCNRLLPSRAEALQALSGTLELALCDDCGHVFNAAFDPGMMVYTQAYENSLHFSPSFQRFAEDLADRLIHRYALRGKDIIDLGCGKGDFLKLICARGNNHGTGFDPSYVPDPADGAAGSCVRFVREFYSEKHTAVPADLIACRHVLEHIDRPRAFVADLRRSVGTRFRTAVYFEVPNVLYTLRDMGIWDLIYEHCSYFSPASLTRLFAGTGFDVTAVYESFGGQYLGLEAHPAQTHQGSFPAGSDDPAETRREAEHFAGRYREKVEAWRETVGRLRREAKRAVVWGGGSKGVTFLNVIGGADLIGMMVDINPRKKGLFVPGTGQEVVDPARLLAAPPDVIIVMNSLYLQEIRSQVEAMGIHADLLIA